jgi:hypothetical protein
VCMPHICFRKGTHSLLGEGLGEGGGEVPDLTRGQTLWYSRYRIQYIYFVILTKRKTAFGIFVIKIGRS